MPEEFHYLYDSADRLVDAASAQTPAAGFTPPGPGDRHSATQRASARACAHYTYDAGGRILTLEHYGQTWGSGGYFSEAIFANDCTY